LSSNDDKVHTIEAEVTQQKRSLASLPSGEHQATITIIMTNTKEIAKEHVTQQTISDLTTNVANKALIFYTQLTTAHLVTSLMIKKMEKMDLIAL
jgi:hypothetical protein